MIWVNKKARFGPMSHLCAVLRGGWRKDRRGWSKSRRGQIAHSIGQAVLNVAIESSALTIAPIPKRNVPASDERCPPYAGIRRGSPLSRWMRPSRRSQQTPPRPPPAPKPTPQQCASITQPIAITKLIRQPGAEHIQRPDPPDKAVLIMVITNRNDIQRRSSNQCWGDTWFSSMYTNGPRSGTKTSRQS